MSAPLLELVCPCRRVDAPVSSLMTPDSETAANNVVLVCHGVQAVMERLDEMKISASIHLIRASPRVSLQLT